MRTAIFAGLIFVGTMIAINKLTDNEIHMIGFLTGGFISMDLLEFIINCRRH